MRRTLEVIGSIASIVGLILSALVVFDLWDRLDPMPLLLACLAVALAACLAFMVRQRRRVPSDDQRRLDQILSTLPRGAIRQIEYEDFAIAWPADLLHPVAIFFNDLGYVEHEFGTKSVESARQELRDAARNLLQVEAINAVMAPDPDRRYVGIPSAELETASRVDRDFYEGRQELIRQTARRFVDAHDALVREARKRGFDLQALSSKVPKPSWTGIPPVSGPPVRARWPHE
jgi:hypothetical protein